MARTKALAYSFSNEIEEITTNCVSACVLNTGEEDVKIFIAAMPQLAGGTADTWWELPPGMKYEITAKSGDFIENIKIDCTSTTDPNTCFVACVY